MDVYNWLDSTGSISITGISLTGVSIVAPMWLWCGENYAALLM